jgi:glutathione S-transferase
VKPLLYAHPFSSYSQKVLIALYENDTPFTLRLLGPTDPSAFTELEALWPLKKFPVLHDQGRVVAESSAIIEHLMLHHPGSLRLIPTNPDAAIETRMMDRFFDNYVMTPMQRLVSDCIRAPAHRDPYGTAEAKSMLQSAYRWLNDVMAQRTWAQGDTFSLADCAAAPALFYADWVREIEGSYSHLRAYRSRLLARPSFARAVDEARPYRHLFPPGAPARD